MSLGSRCVPPQPGGIPSPTSGCAKRAFSEARRISQAIASSQPPPNAYPLTAAMTGCGSRSTALVSACPLRPNAIPPAGVRSTISLISAPAANARSPAPVRITARTERSWPSAWNAAPRRSSCSELNALRACGRFIVTTAMPSSMSTSTAMSASSCFHSYEGGSVCGGIANVAARIFSRRGPLLIREQALFPSRHAHHQSAWGDDGILRDQRRGGDNRLRADLRAGVNDRSHADGDAAADGRARDDVCMSDGDLVADVEGGTASDVKDRAVLDVRSLPDANRRNVAANDGVEPDARIRAHVDVSDDDRAGRQIDTRRDSREDTVEREQQSLAH